jgi:hypothetical protein
VTRISDYDDVPAVPADAVVDPYWQELVRPVSGVPTSYLPPAMPGDHAPWRKAASVVLLVLLTTTTAGGVCLTYGPGELFALLTR